MLSTRALVGIFVALIIVSVAGIAVFTMAARQDIRDYNACRRGGAAIDVCLTGGDSTP